jgi:hypothetical protein
MLPPAPTIEEVRPHRDRLDAAGTRLALRDQIATEHTRRRDGDGDKTCLCPDTHVAMASVE